MLVWHVVSIFQTQVRVPFEQSHKATFWSVTVGTVQYDFSSDVPTLEATWVVLGYIFHIHVLQVSFLSWCFNDLYLAGSSS